MEKYDKICEASPQRARLITRARVTKLIKVRRLRRAGNALQYAT